MDIVKRLRNPSPPNIQFVMYEWMKEAADEIERLLGTLKTIQSINPSAAHAAFLMRDAALAALKEEE